MAKLSRSPWLLHYDASSCNGCDIEVLACLTPVYDVERFGVINTGDPMQADILLVTGGVNTQNASVLKQIYDQMSSPKVVVAVGVCACTGGVFKDTYNILGGADQVIPVDIYVPGCAARPESIIDGVVKAVGLFQERADKKVKNISSAEWAEKKAAEELDKKMADSVTASKEEK
jgi:ech hydrogenase subunit C